MVQSAALLCDCLLDSAISAQPVEAKDESQSHLQLHLSCHKQLAFQSTQRCQEWYTYWPIIFNNPQIGVQAGYYGPHAIRGLSMVIQCFERDSKIAMTI